MNKHQATFLNLASGYQCKYANNDTILWRLMAPIKDMLNLERLIQSLAENKGYGGNLTYTRVENNKAIISSLLFQEATKNDPEEITLTRDDEWNIEITTT